MRRSVKDRLLWAVVGFGLGIVATVLYAALSLWPFEEGVFLHWVRWMGKETIKWSFISVIFVIVAFVIMQIINLILLTREERNKKNPNSGRPA